MNEHSDIPPEVVAQLRSVCLTLPEVYEEQAWVGTRWRIRSRTFAHVVRVQSGSPPAYARAASTDGPTDILTFRSPALEIEALTATGYPFFRPQWGPNVVGMVLDSDVDWGEVSELLTESYCVLAPKKLVAMVNRPEGEIESV